MRSSDYGRTQYNSAGFNISATNMRKVLILFGKFINLLCYLQGSSTPLEVPCFPLDVLFNQQMTLEDALPLKLDRRFLLRLATTISSVLLP